MAWINKTADDYKLYYWRSITLNYILVSLPTYCFMLTVLLIFLIFFHVVIARHFSSLIATRVSFVDYSTLDFVTFFALRSCACSEQKIVVTESGRAARARPTSRVLGNGSSLDFAIGSSVGRAYANRFQNITVHRFPQRRSKRSNLAAGYDTKPANTFKRHPAGPPRE